MPSESGDSEGLLIQAMENLNRGWMRTSGGWHDKARVEFEKQYIDEFRLASKRAEHAMRNVTALLRQVRKECGDQNF